MPTRFFKLPLLATACYARRGLSHHFALLIYLFICLFVQFVNFSCKCYSSQSCGPILMKLGMIVNIVLGYLKTASSCLYCLYMQSYSCLYFPIVSDVPIVMYKFTHHTIDLMKSLCLHSFSFIIKLNKQFAVIFTS